MVVSQNIWREWTSNYTTSATTTYTNVIWSDWINAGSTTITGSYSPNTIWADWANQPVIVQGGYRQQATQVAQEELERREAERQAQRAEEQDRLREAQRRAEELLQVILTDEQWAAYQAKAEFSVIGKSGRRYLIRRGTHGNIKVIEDEVVTESLCIQPPLDEYDEQGRRRPLPLADVMVAQVLGIRHDEENFRRVANITRVNPAAVRRAREALDEIRV